MNQNKCIIIVPLYKTEFDNDEYNSIKQLFNILGQYNIAAIYPESLDLSYYNENFSFNDYYSFWDSHFQNYPYGYNNLLMLDGFYEIFSEYEYMLIYQPDAWVFKDELDYWIYRDYDYIGAPYLYFDYYSAYQQMSPIGNGGFSLRKIKTFIYACKNFHSYADYILNENDPYLGEDHFPMLVNEGENLEVFKMPTFDDAKKFSWDLNPVALFIVNDYELPFGCHAYNKVYNHEIYKDFINYDNPKRYTYVTYIFGDDYDTLREPEIVDPLAEYICITNNYNLKSNVWKFIYDDEINNGNYSNWQRTLLARYKALDYCNTEICIKLDGSILIKKPCFKYINKFINEGYDIGIMMHPFNDSYNDEFCRWVNDRDLNYKQVKDFFNFMHNHNYDMDEKGLIMITILMQRNNEINRKLDKHVLNALMNEMNFDVRVDQMYFTAIFMEEYIDKMKTYFMCLQVLYSKYFEFFYHNSWYSHKDEHEFDLNKKKYYIIKNKETPVEYFL